MRTQLQDPAFIKAHIVDVLQPILQDEGGEPRRRARARESLRALVSGPGRQCIKADDATVTRVEGLLQRHVVPADDRAKRQDTMVAMMADPLPGIQALLVGGATAHAAFIHERGRPRWGPIRLDVKLAKADRKALEAARKEKRLEEALLALKQVHPAPASGVGEAGAGPS